MDDDETQKRERQLQPQQQAATEQDESSLPLPFPVAQNRTANTMLSAKQQALLSEIESLMRDERMEEGDIWFLVAAQWWQQHLGGGAESAPERTDNDDEHDDDEDMAEPKDASDSSEVSNESLVDLEFSSKERKTVVLKPMLVCNCVFCGVAVVIHLGGVTRMYVICMG